MQRKRNGLVPIGDALSGMGGPVAAIRDATPQARHSFTVADQVNQLVRASEADPDRGFMARTMALCSLPRSNPGNRLQYKRVNGPFTLIMYSWGQTKLPFGNFPRLILAWVSTEAVRTQNRVLILGSSLAKFMRELGVYSSGGKPQTRLRNQMKRLFGCTVSMIYEDEHGEQFVSSLIAERGEFWWSKPDELSLWDSAGDTWSPNRRGKAADGPLYSSGVQRIGSVGMTVCHPSVFRQARERAWTSVSRIRVTDVMIA